MPSSLHPRDSRDTKTADFWPFRMQISGSKPSFQSNQSFLYSNRTNSAPWEVVASTLRAARTLATSRCELGRADRPSQPDSGDTTYVRHRHDGGGHTGPEQRPCLVQALARRGVRPQIVCRTAGNETVLSMVRAAWDQRSCRNSPSTVPTSAQMRRCLSTSSSPDSRHARSFCCGRQIALIPRSRRGRSRSPWKSQARSGNNHGGRLRRNRRPAPHTRRQWPK
jgi:hypothetical protein